MRVPTARQQPARRWALAHQQGLTDSVPDLGETYATSQEDAPVGSRAAPNSHIGAVGGRVALIVRDWRTQPAVRGTGIGLDHGGKAHMRRIQVTNRSGAK